MMYLSCGADMDSLPLCVCVSGKGGGGAQGHCQGIRKEGPREREGKRGCRMAGGVLHSASPPSASHLLFAHPPRLGHACQGPVTDGAWVHVCVYVYAAAVWRVDVKGQAHGLGHLPPRSQTNKLPGACLFHLSPRHIQRQTNTPAAPTSKSATAVMMKNVTSATS